MRTRFYLTLSHALAVVSGVAAILLITFGRSAPETTATTVLHHPARHSVALAFGSRHTTAATKPKPQPQPKPKPLPPTYTFGGTTLFPDHRLIALYGTPSYPALGALGDQPMQATIERARQLATEYQSYTTEPAIPALEIITTVASSFPTNNNDYSQEIDPATLQPWIDAAEAAQEYVILDLQSGRSDFLTQAKEYAGLLKNPNVGLALDPEWRLGPGQVPLAQIGSVDIAEVNQTAAWLAALTAENHLPQKLLLLHQFRLDMISNRQALDMSHPELAYVVQMDGNGTPPQKLSTWQSITQDAPAGIYFGWKNFYKEDHPMLDPAGTMALNPKPWYVSYQ